MHSDLTESDLILILCSNNSERPEKVLYHCPNCTVFLLAMQARKEHCSSRIVEGCTAQTLHWKACPAIKSAHELESASQATSRSKSFLTETDLPTQSSSSASSFLSRRPPLPADSSSQTSQVETEAISTWSSYATSLTSWPVAHAPHVIASFLSLRGALILSFLTRLHMCWRLVCPSYTQVERNFQKSAL